ncbi:RadC family protein [Eubacterium oxidoreducens]|uniref:DNA repair protein RadC n=1 Tax=Eubacterium oxidoreducens TaxID=1732 RepID=A0A1G6ALE4_EUBOX|nr:DNA repair protein RadC [Eubacterium oxidoreducens]SDB09207.1 DNA repair protein RadC [Eubacterium oxidoreducens]
MKNTILQMPKHLQPYEKCLQFGVKELTDAELLAVILRTGTKHMNALQLAQVILSDSHGSGLLNIFDKSINELMKYPGIGQTKAIQLKCITELTKRISKLSRRNNLILSNSESVAAYYSEQLRHEQLEHVIISMFDKKSQLIGDEVLSIGTVSESLLSPREVFIKALEHQAVYIILIHNHPSGNKMPSKADKAITRVIMDVGEMLNIQLADHIIIADNEYFSFFEQGLLDR